VKNGIKVELIIPGVGRRPDVATLNKHPTAFAPVRAGARHWPTEWRGERKRLRRAR